MAQIATAAGVSRPTVSYVLNDTAAVRHLKPETVKRIRELAKQMGYSSNDAARAIKTGKSRTLAFITPPLRWDSNFAIVYAAANEAFNLGYQVKYIPLRADKKGVEDCIRICQDFLIPAVICLNIPRQQLLKLAKAAKAAGIRTAQVGDCFPEITPVSILADHRSGCEEVVTHLYELGHRRIALMLNSRAYSSSVMRFEAFLDQMKKLGIAPPPELILEGHFTPDEISRETLALLKLDPRPTAIICDTDPSALTVLTTLQRQGVRVPEDISVTGFVDLPLGQFTVPSLTSVHLPVEELGQHVVRQMVEWSETDKLPTVIPPLPVRVVVRDSSGPCPN
ncbi:LacI family DNA-binding transcriptional regulator [Ruficoccus amylovorans]|uniref:LacI family DNA-binding transcriptional regulator n=1 Tax=Ruficoccus amylovorans TaxID=1804625 RepID=A0A842HBW9_9BACT|nr:LacI family DNA-binding transcriptional regulator [Ruficoccus amylovorans]MBC2593963.1 LacI family DNA-binding transcriptional regulator [Ruficoccus amylovorans]